MQELQFSNKRCHYYCYIFRFLEKEIVIYQYIKERIREYQGINMYCA